MRDEPEDCFFFFFSSSTNPKLFFELLRQNFISPPLNKQPQIFVLEFGLWIYHPMRWWGVKIERWERGKKCEKKRRYRGDNETFCQTSIDSFLYLTIFIPLFYRLPGIYNGAKQPKTNIPLSLAMWLHSSTQNAPTNYNRCIIHA